MVFSKSQNIPAALTSQKAIDEKAAIMAKVNAQQDISSDDFKSSIYGENEVRDQILTDQHHICAYCGDYMRGRGEVDHYRPKTECQQELGSQVIKPAYYWLAYEWDNLIGSCHLCNTIKGNYFPLNDETTRDIEHTNTSAEEALLINPYKDNPSNFLEYCLYWVYPRKDDQGNDNKKGAATISVLKLNERADLTELRFQAWMTFERNARNNHWTYQEALQDLVSNMQSMGRMEEDIAFHDMYMNQCFPFSYK